MKREHFDLVRSKFHNVSGVYIWFPAGCTYVRMEKLHVVKLTSHTMRYTIGDGIYTVVAGITTLKEAKRMLKFITETEVLFL